MKERLIVAPNYKEVYGRVIFLAGPIQGAKDWQSRAAEIILSADPKITVASPRRPMVAKGDFGEDLYKEQVNWETHFLRRAARWGTVMFWLAKESDHACDRAFAQTTRFELGEWKAKAEKDKVKLTTGIEEGFTGAKYIKLRFPQDAPYIPICKTLEETCYNAILSANRSRRSFRDFWRGAF